MLDEKQRRALFDAIMIIAVEGKWLGCQLLDIAKEANLEVGFVESTFSNKIDILRAYAESIDQEVASRVSQDFLDPALPLHDRLLEILLVRFDILKRHKAGIRVLAQLMKKDPRLLFYGAPALYRSMHASLEFIGISSVGVCRVVQTKGLTLVFLSGFATWLDDETPDSSVTMRKLDHRLRQVGTLAHTFSMPLQGTTKG